MLARNDSNSCNFLSKKRANFHYRVVLKEIQENQMRRGIAHRRRKHARQISHSDTLQTPSVPARSQSINCHQPRNHTSGVKERNRTHHKNAQSEIVWESSFSEKVIELGEIVDVMKKQSVRGEPVHKRKGYKSLWQSRDHDIPSFEGQIK